MPPLSQNAAATYRKIDLDARIEASGDGDLTLICLEEAVAAMRRAHLACRNGAGRSGRSAGAVSDPLQRAHGIALWLCRGVADDNPLRHHLIQFYGGIAAQIRSNLAQPQPAAMAEILTDLEDLLEAARSTQAAQANQNVAKAA
ncbi:MAG: hypothetical protein ABJP48_10015 [Erythrobacter sp.]